MDVLKERKGCLKFLSGLGIALHVAAFEMDEPIAAGNELLDIKGEKPTTFRGVAPVTLHEMPNGVEVAENGTSPKTSPRADIIPVEVDAVKLEEINSPTSTVTPVTPVTPAASSTTANPPPSGVKKATAAAPAPAPSTPRAVTPTNTPSTPASAPSTPAGGPPAPVLGKGVIVKGGELDISSSNYDASTGRRRKMGAVGSSSEEAAKANQTAIVSPATGKTRELKYWVPAWEPLDDWAFPVADLPVLLKVPSNLTMDSFTGLRHIGDGSNSNIYLGYLSAKQVIVKMIKENVADDDVACHEFDMEHGILARLNHPNIIKIVGAGHLPRRFVVVEYLGGGSLNGVLSQNIAKPGFANKLFRKPTFTYPVLLQRARDLADSLDYLHRRFFPGCTLIHRDLKPDNVGFTGDGVLKLFDFGLCTLVRNRPNATDTYEMTGNTGSLRYMAPEVNWDHKLCVALNHSSRFLFLWCCAGLSSGAVHREMRRVQLRHHAVANGS
jgi:hypothetical protein